MFSQDLSAFFLKLKKMWHLLNHDIFTKSGGRFKKSKKDVAPVESRHACAGAFTAAAAAYKDQFYGHSL